MITVTFPSGVRVTYNSANRTEWSGSVVTLLREDEKGKRWIVAYVSLSSGAIIEHTRPCKITAPPIPSNEAAIDELLRQFQCGQLKATASWKVKALKQVLGTFNARTRCWK